MTGGRVISAFVTVVGFNRGKDDHSDAVDPSMSLNRSWNSARMLSANVWFSSSLHSSVHFQFNSRETYLSASISLSVG